MFIYTYICYISIYILFTYIYIERACFIYYILCSILSVDTYHIICYILYILSTMYKHYILHIMYIYI